MIIGVMSDSHGDGVAIEKAVDAIGEVDFWLHAGDFCSDAATLAEYSGKKVYAVAGNCDGLAAKSKVDEFLTVEGKKIWLTHGHQSSVKYGTDDLIWNAKQYGVDIVIYGHTHISEISRYDDLYIINPGSVARPYQVTAPTCLKLTINKQEVFAELVEL